jgi:FlgD Ig-like domain
MVINKNISKILNKSSLTETIKNEQKQIFAFKNRILFIAFILTAFFSFPGLVSGQAVNNFAATNPYTFTLSKAAVTSAGVYRVIDSTLVRTLWSAVNYNAGTYSIKWDGKDDRGNQMPAGNYIVKVMSNNVKYAWMGVVGNSSDSTTGSTVHRGYYYCKTGMTIVNGTAYYSTGYSEGSPSVAKFFTAKPQQKVDFEAYNTNTAYTDMCASDGKMVYWAGFDPFNLTNTWVFANNVNDDSNVTFANGVNYKPKVARAYNAISYLNQANSIISGMAVQKTGNLLFVSREGLNQLSVLDKTTGKLLQNIPINGPKALCTDMNDNLWMVSDSNLVTKYQVSATGTLSAPLLTISSVLIPVALSVSPDNTTITIADGGLTSQQVKAFSNVTGLPTWTLGAPGGYMQDASVNNNKFYFNDVRGLMYYGGEAGFRVFIAYQPDGSFWVNDPGNFRVQHYSANRTYIETIMSLGASYSTWADKNDNTRVGAEYLEFKIDNTKPMTGSTGWKLVKNWGATVSSSYDKTTKFATVITLTSAGVSRTYGFLRIATNYFLVEFQNNNALRFTGIIKNHCNIGKDGSILTDDFKKYAFMGFDNLNNPIWSATPIILADVSKLTDIGPLPKAFVKNSYLTSSGKVLFYDYGLQLTTHPTITFNTGFHLGAIQQGGNSYLWESAMSTHTNYAGSFPDPSRFDIGNKVNNYAGSAVMVAGQNVVTGYHGEFWKNSQANMYNHYWDNGLAIGQFGTTGPYFVLAPAMMAGNALSPQLVDGASADELYLWHGDESFHAGMHKWKITGLSTIAEQDIPITYPAPAVTPLTIPGADLMVNLPYNSPLLNNTAGWTFNPVTTSVGIMPNASTGWSINTNVLVSGTQSDPDIYVKCNSLTGTFSLNRDLGNNTGLPYWSVSGFISYDNCSQQGNMLQYFDILDNNGKIIARISNTFVFVSNVLNTNTNTIFGNNKVLIGGLNTFIQGLKSTFQPVAVSAVNNLVTISYAGYTVTAPIFDPTADITSPKTMRCYTIGGFNPTVRTFDFKDMRFVTTKTNQTISFNAIAAQAFGNPPFSLIALSSVDLPVAFTVVSGPATITGNTITLTGAGTVVVQASQPGNTSYNAASPVIQSFTVTNNLNARTDL